MSKTEGRMIKKSISDSKGFASLSPNAAVLFCMLIPHLNSHGKMNGGPGYIKDEICPRVSYLTLELVESYLKEISEKTSVKWFEHDGRKWIHSINFLEKHQKLPMDKLGTDKLPTYSRVDQELGCLEVEVKEEVKEQAKEEKSKICLPDNFSEKCKAVRSAICKVSLSATDLEIIKSWEYSEDEITNACKLTRDRGGKSVNYIDSILRTEADKKVKEPEFLHPSHRPAPDPMAPEVKQ